MHRDKKSLPSVCIYVWSSHSSTRYLVYCKAKYQPGKVANSARGQLNGENEFFLSPFVLKNLVSRDGFGSPVPRRQPAHLYIWAESGAYLLDSSRVPRRRPFFFFDCHTPSGKSRVYRVTQNCVPMAFTAESPPAQGQ